MKFFQKLAITLGIVATVAATALGWVKLPKRVGKVEVKQEKAKVERQQTQSELNMFIMEQRTIQQSSERREQMMKDYIDAKTEAR